MSGGDDDDDGDDFSSRSSESRLTSTGCSLFPSSSTLSVRVLWSSEEEEEEEEKDGDSIAN